MFSRFDVCWTQTKRQAEDRKQGRKSQKSLSKSENLHYLRHFVQIKVSWALPSLQGRRPIEILPTVHLSIFNDEEFVLA